MLANTPGRSLISNFARTHCQAKIMGITTPTFSGDVDAMPGGSRERDVAPPVMSISASWSTRRRRLAPWAGDAFIDVAATHIFVYQFALAMTTIG
jgi:hypothetical protein